MIFLSQRLREINFGGSRSAKSAISKHLEALNLDFCEFLHFLKAEMYQIKKIQGPHNSKKAFFEISETLNYVFWSISAFQKC